MTDWREEEEFTALRGVFAMGGPGAYIFEGKSGSGKNFLLERMLAKSPIKFKNVVSLSTTQEDSGSLDFIERLYDGERWAIAKSLEDLMHVVKVRTDCLEKIKKSLGTREKDAFLEENPMLMIVDDIGGTTNTKNAEKNPWYTLFTTVRHRGIFLVVLVQYHKQIGPAFLGNTRALLTFDYTEQALKWFASCSGMNITNQDKLTLQKFLKTRFNFLIWWKNWMSEAPLPDTPWLCEKLCPEIHSACVINGSSYQQFPPARNMKSAVTVKNEPPEYSDDYDDYEDVNSDDMSS